MSANDLSIRHAEGTTILSRSSRRRRLPFDLPAVRRKKVIAAFDGGLISSDGGLVLLREAEWRLGLA